MKMKSLITLTLLFVLGFSMVHEYAAFSSHEDEHYMSSEHLEEHYVSVEHDEACEVHFEYHQSFVLFTHGVMQTLDTPFLAKTSEKETYNFSIPLHFLKPPIV